MSTFGAFGLGESVRYQQREERARFRAEKAEQKAKEKARKKAQNEEKKAKKKEERKKRAGSETRATQFERFTPNAIVVNPARSTVNAYSHISAQAKTPHAKGFRKFGETVFYTPVIAGFSVLIGAVDGVFEVASDIDEAVTGRPSSRRPVLYPDSAKEFQRTLATPASEAPAQNLREVKTWEKLVPGDKMVTRPFISATHCWHHINDTIGGANTQENASGWKGFIRRKVAPVVTLPLAGGAGLYFDFWLEIETEFNEMGSLFSHQKPTMASPAPILFPNDVVERTIR